MILLLFITQGLALRRNYHLRQSLSALHEKSAAWLGLGSAVTGMWRQRTQKNRTTPTGIFLILAYLGGQFALGSTDAALLEVSFVDSNDPLLANTTTFLQSVTANE